MSRYESREDLAEKVDYEGGVTEAINGYGIGSDELPEDTPTDVVDAWQKVEAVSSAVDCISAWLFP